MHLYSVGSKHEERRWLELIKYYDLEVHYHPGKAIVVADALSRKVHCNHLVEPVSDPLCEEMRKLNLEVVEQGNLYALAAESNIYDRIVSGFSTAGSKFLSIACRARTASAGDNGVYTGSGLRGVIPYVQCVAVVFLSQVCS
jgi:hypothetical protein